MSFGEKSKNEVSAINSKEIMYSLTIFKSELLHKIWKNCARKKVLRSFAKIYACFPMSGAAGVLSSNSTWKSKTDFIQLVVARFITCCDSECCDMRLVRIRNEAALGIYPEVSI